MHTFSSLADPLLQMGWTLRTGVLAVLLAAAAAVDWRTLRLPNALTVPGIACGLLVNALDGGIGFTAAALGAALGLGLLLPLWMLRVLGAGDVKLMAMVGAFLGAPEVVMAVLFSFIAGGVLAVAFAARRRRTAEMLSNVRHAVVGGAFALAAGQRVDVAAMPSVGKLPYGVGICAGTLAWLLVAH